MNTARCLYGGPLFDGQTLCPDGHVIIEDGKIASFGAGKPSLKCAALLDVQGRLLAPGFVDLHSDALEKCIEQRPGARFDHVFALQGLDRRLAASGVTTFCHAVAFLDSQMGLRSPDAAASIVRSVQEFADSPRSLIRHRVHIRFEVGSRDSARTIQNLLQHQPAALFSIMDHSPGQGQFKTMESFLHYYAETYAISLERAESIGRERAQKSSSAWDDSLGLLETVRSHGIPILSHDDDTVDKVDMAHALGASGSEFPVSIEAATRAREKGMHVCMGAPNLIRGRSTNNNVAAADVLQAGLCDTLVSDYSPESLPQSPFLAQRELGLDLGEGMRTVTANPGSLLATERLSPGRLRVGAEADLVIIDRTEPWIQVWETWVGGRRVFAAHERA